MVDDDGENAGDEETGDPAASRRAWLTYRYRLGGEDTREATGTMKAPSFLNAARRILARGLGDTVGLAPAYLRLRAVGEQEVLFRIERTGAGDAAAFRVDVVPSGTYMFAEAGSAGAGAEQRTPKSAAG